MFGRLRKMGEIYLGGFFMRLWSWMDLFDIPVHYDLKFLWRLDLMPDYVARAKAGERVWVKSFWLRFFIGCVLPIIFYLTFVSITTLYC